MRIGVWDTLTVYLLFPSGVPYNEQRRGKKEKGEKEREAEGSSRPKGAPTAIPSFPTLPGERGKKEGKKKKKREKEKERKIAGSIHRPLGFSFITF